MYPSNDEQFEEVQVASVAAESEGWNISRSDGWSFYVPKDSPVEPVAGMTARFYGKGIGYTVRGLFLDGQKVFYRSEEDEKTHHEITTYGKDAQDWLNRWDEGRSVWSVAMGGFGPGYEQAIQIAAVEVVRFMLGKGYDSTEWAETEVWQGVCKEVEGAMLKQLDKLGLSGMQWGAALQLGARVYRDGPAKAVKAAPDERHIQVSKNFPSL